MGSGWPDVKAAYDYVDTVTGHADNHTWRGWSIREAFLAGISHSEKESQ